MNKKMQKEENTRSSSGMSEQLSLQQQKKRKFYIKQAIYVLYFLIRIALTVVILVVLHQNFIKILFDTNQYKRMQQNIGLWKLDVIMNITTVNSYNCPQGFQTYTSYVWPGTKQGCYCHIQLDSWDYIKILEGSCSQLAMGAGCTRIQKLSSIPFLFWKKDELICIKRVKNMNFFTNLDQRKIMKNKCSQTANYQFDIPSSLPLNACPLTQIKNDNSLNQKLSQINFSFDRQSEYPIVALKMTEYEFCPDFSQQNISPNKQRDKNYNLQNIIKQPCQGIDSRVIIIDKVAQNQLFQSNTRIMDAIKTLPAYPEPNQDYVYKLGYIRYPEWTYNCRKSQNFNLYKTQFHLNLEQISNYSTLCIAFATIFSIFYGFLFTIFYIYRKITEVYYKFQQKVLYDTLPQLQKKKPNLFEKISKKFLFQLIIFGVKFLAGLSCLIILTVFFQQIQTYFNWYKQSRSCTSKVMISWIQIAYISNFQSQQRNLLTCIILTLTTILIDGIMFFWRTFRGDLKREQYGQQITNVFDEQVNQKNLQIKSFETSSDIKDAEFQVKNQKQYNKTAKIHILHNMTQDQLIEMQELDIGKRTMARPKRVPRRKSQLSGVQRTQESEEWNLQN